MTGVVKTTSPMRRSRTSRIFTNRLLLLDGGLVDQHDGDVVLDRIHTMALSAFQRAAVLDEADRRFAVGTREDFQQFRIERHRRLQRQHRTIASGLRSPGMLLK